MAEPASMLRAAELTATLTGEHRAPGTGVDLVIALEEWERFELGFIASASGRAFGEEEGAWSYLSFLDMRFAF